MKYVFGTARELKRQRLTLTSEGAAGDATAISPEGADAFPTSWATATAASAIPDAVASAGHDSRTPTNRPATVVGLPSGPVLCRELSKFSGTRTVAIQALNTIGKWVMLSCYENRDDDYATFMKLFVLYGGFPRLFDFLKSQMEDAECVSKAAIVLKWSTKMSRYGAEVSKAVELSGGNHTLLLANDEFGSGTTDAELEVVVEIWRALSNIHALEPKPGREQALLVVEAACDWLDKLSTIHSSDLLEVVLCFLKKQTVVDLQCRMVIPQSVKALHAHRKSLKGNRNLSSAAVSFFFGRCCEKKGPCTTQEYEDILMFCAQALCDFPSSRKIQFYGLHLLYDICAKVKKAKVLKSDAGVALARVLQVENLDGRTKKRAFAIMREICT
jgi:hypothetical protein